MNIKTLILQSVVVHVRPVDQTPPKRSEELTGHITVHAMAREGGEEEVSV